jgi:hypothetical protein
MSSKAYREGYSEIQWGEPFGTSRIREKGEARAFHYIPDELPHAVQSQASGKFYTSKAKLRQEYRELGYVEVGNDPARMKGYDRPRIDRQKVHETLQRARARFERGERANGSPRRS